MHTQAAPASAGDSAFPSAEIKIGSSVIEVRFSGQAIDLSEAQVLQWVETAAQAVAKYYGRFPVPRVRLQINLAFRERGVFHGETFGSQVPFTRISLGRYTTVSDLSNDWTMTHEFIHMAFPQVADEHHWIEEGIATYVEPIARVQLGKMDAATIWSEMARDMPKGEPAPGDRGLDHTRTWGRTYWGGALFCLTADVRIRERTANRQGLQDALRAIMEAGGTIQYDWDLQQAFTIGDRATGVPVLTELYQQMRDSPAPVDLTRLWKQLGIKQAAGTLEFDDHAPLAAIRRAITSPPREINAPRDGD